MTNQEFIEALEEKGFTLTDQQKDQFEKYFELLVEWNEKMNLTSITEKREVYLKHFYDSLTLAFYVDLSKVETLCDVGAGAGFPSVPLKILYPHLKVTIIDSLKKRMTFLEHLFQELGLTDIQAVHGRAEDLGQNPNYRGQYDLVTARAVARLSVLSEFCIPFAKKGGHFVAMKAAAAEEELADAKKAIAILGGKVNTDYEFNLVDAGERHIIVIEKTKETPNKYPRKAGTPGKKPIS